MLAALYENTMSESLKQKLLGLTAARYKQLIMAAETFKEGDDPLGILLRVHLLTEGILEELIRLSFGENSEALLSINLTYRQKLDLVSRIEIDDNWPLLEDFMIGSLRKLNKLRNQLAHNLNAGLENRQVIELFMHIEQVYGDMSDASVSINLKRYSYFILGSLLPKYEEIGDDEII